MMRLFLLPLLSLSLIGQDAPGDSAARGLISSNLIASFEPFGTRPVRTDLTLIYLDSTKDDQFVDVAALRTETSTLIRDIGSQTLSPEAYAKALAKGLLERHPQIVGITVSMGLNLQTTSQFVVTLSRLAPALPPAMRSDVAHRLAEDAQRAQTGIVR